MYGSKLQTKRTELPGEFLENSGIVSQIILSFGKILMTSLLFDFDSFDGYCKINWHPREDVRMLQENAWILSYLVSYSTISMNWTFHSKATSSHDKTLDLGSNGYWYPSSTIHPEKKKTTPNLSRIIESPTDFNKKKFMFHLHIYIYICIFFWGGG